MTNFWEILDFETDGFRFRLPAVAKVLENQKLLEVYSPLNWEDKALILAACPPVKLFIHESQE